MKQEASKIKNFTDLYAWQEAHKLALIVYKITKKFPGEEKFGLTSQIRRAVVSITSNIAEGFSRQSLSEKAHFYSIAQGSTTETQNQLLLARDLGYISPQVFHDVASQSVITHKLLSGLIKSSKIHAS